MLDNYCSFLSTIMYWYLWLTTTVERTNVAVQNGELHILLVNILAVHLNRCTKIIDSSLISTMASGRSAEKYDRKGALKWHFRVRLMRPPFQRLQPLSFAVNPGSHILQFSRELGRTYKFKCIEQPSRKARFIAFLFIFNLNKSAPWGKAFFRF